jgi:hypothetical protein
MTNGAIFHFDEQVVALDEHDLAVLDGDVLGGWPSRRALLRLNLSDRRRGKNDTDYPDCQYDPDFDPIA